MYMMSVGSIVKAVPSDKATASHRFFVLHCTAVIDVESIDISRSFKWFQAKTKAEK
jgi:hypothetical protein